MSLEWSVFLSCNLVVGVMNHFLVIPLLYPVPLNCTLVNRKRCISFSDVILPLRVLGGPLCLFSGLVSH